MKSLHTQPLTYHAYRADPAIRRQIDGEVARLRAEAFLAYVVRPIGAWLRAIGTKARAPAPTAR